MLDRVTAPATNVLSLKTNLMRRASVTALGLAVSLSATGALAQAAAEAEVEEAVQEVVVTGSRLRDPGVVSPTPLTVVGGEQISQVGATTVNDMIAYVPQFRQSSGPGQLTRGSVFQNTGQSRVDLRGLGAERTLLLINGQRPVPTNSGGTTSTSIIPVALIERMEVVTGGASAAYGSDAVAGVANFVLKSRIEGIEGSVNYGISEEGDNESHGFSIGAGKSLLNDRLRLMIGADYDKNRGTDDLHARSWGDIRPGGSGTPIPFGAARGPLTPAFGWATGVAYATQTPGGVINSARTATGAVSTILNQTAFGPGGAPFRLQRGPVFGNLMIDSTSNPDASPILGWNLKQPVRQFASLARAAYDLNDTTEVFFQANYARNHVAGTATGHSSPTITILQNNPYLPESVRATMVANNITQFDMGRADIDWPGTTADNNTTTTMFTVGVKGELAERFSWDVSYMHGRTVLDQNLFSTREANFYASLYAVRDASGAIVCGPVASNPNFAANRLTSAISPANVLPGCVPTNPFGQGSPSSQAISYFTGVQHTALIMRRRSLAANVAGPLFTLPAGKVDAAVGVEFRDDRANQYVDPLQQAGIYAAGNQQPFSGKNDVYEGFGEISVPLLADMPLVRSLGLNGAFRYTHYETSGAVSTWKLGGTYEPVAGLRFRATRSRDIRAPSLYDLFSQGLFGFTGNFTNPFNGYTGRLPVGTTGNPNLDPEKADTLTMGVSYQGQSGWLTGVRLSADYYRVRIKDAIASPAVPDILSQCFNGNQSFCAVIQFDNSPVGIRRIEVQPFNQAKLEVEGFDFEVGYRRDLESWGLRGELDVSAYATHVAHYKTTDKPGAATIDYAGYLTATPKWVMSAFVNYRLDPVTVGISAQGFDKIGHSPLFIGPGQDGYNPAAATSINKNFFPGLVYFNLNGSYDLRLDDRSYRLFVNVNNLFDRTPPALAIAALNAGGNPYDYIGRTFKFGLRFDF